MPEPGPVIEVENLVSVDEESVARLVRELVKPDSPTVRPDSRLADGVACARRRAPGNRTPQPWMAKVVIGGLETDLLHDYAQRPKLSGPAHEGVRLQPPMAGSAVVHR